MDAPNVKFKTVDLTNQVSTPSSGISFVLGESLRGDFNNPKDIFSSWPSFIKEYGAKPGLHSLLLKRLLEKGGLVRFCRLGNYTTIANASTLTALKATPDDDIFDIDITPDTKIFTLVPKYAGADYNNLRVRITAASNGQSEYFNLYVEHLLESGLNESYENLTIVGNPTALDSDYLSAIVNGSSLVDVVYENLSILEAIEFRPANTSITFSGGTDGSALVDADKIGDPASSTGLHAFDNYDDAYQMFFLGNHSNAVNIAGGAYASVRQDLQYWHFLPNSYISKSQLISQRATLGFNDEFTALFAGGLKVTNNFTNQLQNIEAITDIAALASVSDTLNGPFLSFSGNKRGVITNALGVVNNFGTPAKAGELNELANRQINCLIQNSGKIKLWGGFTTMIGNNQRQFINVVRGIFYIKKSLRPTMENYLEEPNDIPTWQLMYRECKPFLDSLVTRRALYSYIWQGDQDAKSLDDLQVNLKADVALGKYKVKLILDFIPGIQSVEVFLIINNGNLSFELINSVTN
jgi:hypothetical protein